MGRIPPLPSHLESIEVKLHVCISVSPAGSLQDVSPPTTPSSRPNMYDQSSHTPSPNLITAVSPQVSQHHGVPSPQLHYPQPSSQFPPRHGVPLGQNLFPKCQLQVLHERRSNIPLHSTSTMLDRREHSPK